jgi:hypothetical protein
MILADEGQPCPDSIRSYHLERLIKAHDRIWKLRHIPFRRREAACRALEETLRAMILVSGPQRSHPALRASAVGA